MKTIRTLKELDGYKEDDKIINYSNGVLYITKRNESKPFTTLTTENRSNKEIINYLRFNGFSVDIDDEPYIDMACSNCGKTNEYTYDGESYREYDDGVYTRRLKVCFICSCGTVKHIIDDYCNSGTSSFI